MLDWQDMVDIGVSRSLGWDGQTSLRFPWDKRDQKLGAVQDYLVNQPDRPFIWVDDDREVIQVERRWARSRAVPHLIIQPQKTIGLTPAHVRKIERWCRDVLARSYHGIPSAQLAPPGPWVAGDPGLEVKECLKTTTI